MNWDHLSIVELNDRAKAVTRWTDASRRIRRSSQDIGGGLSPRGRYLLEELAVVPLVPLINVGNSDNSVWYPRFLLRAHTGGRIKVNCWPEKGSGSNFGSRCMKPGFGRR